MKKILLILMMVIVWASASFAQDDAADWFKKEKEKSERRIKEIEQQLKNDIRQDKKRLMEQEKKRAEKEAKEKAEKEAKREEAIKKQPEHIQSWLRKRLIFIGMTQEQVILSLNEPRRINRTVTRWGVREQWVYERWGYKYLYFENEVLIGWQE